MRAPRPGAALLAALALILIAPAARADEAPSLADIVFPEPVEVVFTVESEDGAERTTETGADTLTTLSGDVNFDVDSDALTERAVEILDALAADWADTPPSRVTITGHTDSVADDAHNLDLSQRRARSVAERLSAALPGLELVSEGKGEAEPIASNASEEGRALNRRVEIRAEK